MAISTGVMKIIVQIINVLYMISGLIALGLGISTLINPKFMTDLMYPAEVQRFLNTNQINEAMRVVGPTLIVVGGIFLLLTIFGIYAVSKSKPFSTKVYAIINIIFLVLAVLDVFIRYITIMKIVDIIVRIILVVFCTMLSQRFREKNSVGTVNYTNA